MMEILLRLEHLWPDFAALSQGATEGLSTIFWVIMVAIFSLAMCGLGYVWLSFRQNLAALNGLLDGLDGTQLAETRRSVEQRARVLEPQPIGELWLEFDESLVISADGTTLYNTLEAEQFFNVRTLAPGLSGSRLLMAVPSFLVAVGVLGTFVGLTVGLSSLDIGSTTDVTDAAMQTLREGIGNLIASAAVAFMTSVWGVLLSLLLNVIEKNAERVALKRIIGVQNRIDSIYPRLTPELSLNQISDHTRESQAALQELHERIGDRLQQAVEGMSGAMQEALTKTLQNVLGPAINTLVDNANQQGTTALENLVKRFAESMERSGREQGEQLNSAAQAVEVGVSTLAERTEAMALRFEEVMRERTAADGLQREQYERQVEELGSRLAAGLEKQLKLAGEHDNARSGAVSALLSEIKEQQEAFATDAKEAAGDVLGQIESTMQRMVTGVEQHLTDQAAAADQRENERQTLLSQQFAASIDKHEGLIAGVDKVLVKIENQWKELTEQHRVLMESLERASESTAESSRHMASSATELSGLAPHVKAAAELLDARIAAATDQLKAMSVENQTLAESLRVQCEEMRGLQPQILDAASSMKGGAEAASTAFRELGSKQDEFLTGVRERFDALGESLRKEVESIEEQAAQWLEHYSELVSRQTGDRMQTWDEQTRQFSDQMLRAVQNISNVVDELESRVK